MKLRNKTTTFTPTNRWDVVVVQAMAGTHYTRERYGEVKKRSFYDAMFADSATPLSGKIAVRLRFDCRDVMTFGMVDLAAEDFEDKITTMKAAAQEKAAALEAVGAVGS